MGEGIHNVLDPTEILENQDTIIEDIADVQVTVDNIKTEVAIIRAKTDAIADLEETGGELTTDGTEQNVYINNAPAGVYTPKWLIMDFANHTATETVLLRSYYRIAPGGPWVVDDRETIVGVPVNAGIKIQLNDNR